MKRKKIFLILLSAFTFNVYSQEVDLSLQYTCSLDCSQLIDGNKDFCLMMSEDFADNAPEKLMPENYIQIFHSSRFEDKTYLVLIHSTKYDGQNPVAGEGFYISSNAMLYKDLVTSTEDMTRNLGNWTQKLRIQKNQYKIPRLSYRISSAQLNIESETSFGMCSSRSITQSQLKVKMNSGNGEVVYDLPMKCKMSGSESGGCI